MTLLEDDVLVRELVSRADRALPAMAVDPVLVLAGGRRRRRRARRWAVGAVGVTTAGVVVALGVGPLGGSATAPAATSEVLRGDGFTVTVPTAAVALDTSAGTVLDLGVPVDAAQPDGSRYVVLETADGLELRTITPDGRLDPSPAMTMGWSTDGLSAGGVGAGSGDKDRAVVLTAMSDPTTDLSAVTVDGKVLTILTPFATPDGSPFVTLAVVQTDGRPVAELPAIAVGGMDLVPDLLAGRTVEQYTVDGEAAAAGLQVGVATEVREVDSSAGTVLDLGVPVLDDNARPTPGGREELTYVLLGTTWGEATRDASLTPAQAAEEAVTIGGRRPSGAVTPLGSTPLSFARTDGSPVLAATYSGSGDVVTDLTVLGLLPDGATSARVLVPLPSGRQVMALPTFTVPGLSGGHQFFFFSIHDGMNDVTTAPAQIELTGADGYGTVWTLTGDPQGVTY